MEKLFYKLYSLLFPLKYVEVYNVYSKKPIDFDNVRRIYRKNGLVYFRNFGFEKYAIPETKIIGIKIKKSDKKRKKEIEELTEAMRKIFKDPTLTLNI